MTISKSATCCESDAGEEVMAEACIAAAGDLLIVTTDPIAAGTEALQRASPGQADIEFHEVIEAQ